MKQSLFLLLVFTLTSCKPVANKVVDVFTNGILAPVSINFSRPLEIGEQAVNAENSIAISIEIKNNSSDPIRKMAFTIDSTQNLLKFVIDQNGKTSTPGYLGSCGDTLAPGEKCTYEIAFSLRKTGSYNIPITFNYENLIEPQKKDFTVTAFVGEPASLAFTNDITNYNMGALEQTEAIQKTIILEVQNYGGLSARNVAFSLDNSETIGAYSVVKNECPDQITAGMKCNITIGYMPHNNLYTDAEINYTGKYYIDYLKDPVGTLAHLNASFTFLSSTIEAKFKENFNSLDFSTITAGTKAVLPIRISNIGYRSGIMKEMNFYNNAGTFLGTCKKASSGSMLDCPNNLITFPFKVEDRDNCFEREVAGVIADTPGESCILNVTYWPSSTYAVGSQAAHNFNLSTIDLKYDSQWKGKPNLVTKSSMFTIKADFKATGKLFLSQVAMDGIPVLSNVTSNLNIYESNLGRIAKVINATYTTVISVTFKNIGETAVVFTALTDGAVVPHSITDVPYDLNSFYTQIVHSNCLTVTPLATCSISYKLAPVKQTTTQLEDSLMYDNIANQLRKYKSFIATYKDGADYEDNDIPRPNQKLEVQLVSQLIGKGLLKYASNSDVFPLQMNGTSKSRNIYLTNIGTESIFAIIPHSLQNINPIAGQRNFPFQMIATPTPICPGSPIACKDCYSLLYPAGSTASTMGATPDTAKFLGSGEVCVLAVENKLANNIRMTDANYGTLADPEYSRLFSGNLNGTSEMWGRLAPSQAALPISFIFYDGDRDTTNILTTALSVPYGYQKVSQYITMASSFTNPANIVLSNPSPQTSAILVRPPLHYPQVTATYPPAAVATPLAAHDLLSETIFDVFSFQTTANNFLKSNLSKNHVAAWRLTGQPYDNEYKFHAGTFPVTIPATSIPMSFSFTNWGLSAATQATLTQGTETLNNAASGTTAIQIASFGSGQASPFTPFTFASKAVAALNLTFTPTLAGLYKKCFTLTYNSGLDIRNQYVCVYAEAIASAPNIKIEFSDLIVTQPVGSPVTETETGTFYTLVTPLNSTDKTILPSFQAIKQTTGYSKKRIRITNIGGTNATKLNVFYLSAFNTPPSPSMPTDTTLDYKQANSTNNLPFPCSVTNLTLTPGSYCEFYIKYLPTNSSVSKPAYLGVLYDIGNGLNQYVANTGVMDFQALLPANLAVNTTGITLKTITDWSTPTAPTNRSSYELNLGTYSAAATPVHMLLAANPTTKSFTNIEIKNTTTLKASFLNLNSNPTTGINDWNVIISNSDVTIKANHYCFWGEDLTTNPDAGFLSGPLYNKCYVQIDFKGTKPYSSCNNATKTYTPSFGQAINAACNPFVYNLKYYSYKRLTYGDLYVHIAGFIEPNKVSNATPVLSNISAVSTSATKGSASFTWPALTPVNTGWGSITKYRIYYDTNYNNLKTDKLFLATSPIAYLETANSTTRNITIANLTAGSYYFFKVFAVQNIAGLVYYSNSNIPILTLPIPRSTEIYYPQLSMLIDKAYINRASPGSKTAAKAACAAQLYSLNIAGPVIKSTKALITTQIFNYLATSESLSSGYPAPDSSTLSPVVIPGVGQAPHWVDDPLYDLSTSLPVFNGSVLATGFPGYDPTLATGDDPVHRIFYQKDPTRLTSNLLYKIIGGDGVGAYTGGVYYTIDNGYAAFPRCYSVIPCPSATTKKITDPTCPAF
jgi:hypothetical protein